MTSSYPFPNNDLVKSFLTQWHDAVSKCELLVDLHSRSKIKLDAIVQQLTGNAKKYHKNQENFCAVQVVVGVSAVFTGGLSLAFSPSVSLFKCASTLDYRKSVKNLWDQAREILYKDHQARQAFIQAAQSVLKSRVHLCNDCPQLNSYHLNYLAATFSLAVPQVGRLIMHRFANAPQGNPEVLSQKTGNISDPCANLTADAVLDTIGATVGDAISDIIPFLGIGVSVVGLCQAEQATKNGSLEATKLVGAMKESEAHYQSMQLWIQTFDHKAYQMLRQELQ